MYGSTDERFYLYDAQSITHPSKDAVRAWEKQVFTEKGVEAMRKLRETSSTLDYIIALKEYDCKEKKSVSLQLIAYSKDGSILENSRPSKGWNFIAPDTVGDSLFKILCKTTSKQKPTK